VAKIAKPISSWRVPPVYILEARHCALLERQVYLLIFKPARLVGRKLLFKRFD
jgi:hypothetical protein